MERSRQRIQRQAASLNVYDQIHVWSEHDLGDDFRRRHRSILRPGSRGFGYWIWKPYLIDSLLRRMSDGDVLHYADVLSCSW